jgi:hypothetical protein
MLFGQRFVWVTDCYAIKFILSYKPIGAAPRWHFLGGRKGVF